MRLSGLKQLEYTDEDKGKIKKNRMPKPVKESYEKIRYHMNATGEYGQLVNFMRKLEGGPSFYRLEKFKVSRDKEKIGNTLSMDVSLLILGRNDS